MAAGGPLWFVGRAEPGIPVMRQELEIDPDNFIAHWCLGYACAVAGRLDDAKKHAAACRRLFDGVPLRGSSLRSSTASRAAQAAAREWLGPINIAVLDPHQQFHLAEACIVAGDLERGLELLERSNAGLSTRSCTSPTAPPFPRSGAADAPVSGGAAPGERTDGGVRTRRGKEWSDPGLTQEPFTNGLIVRLLKPFICR